MGKGIIRITPELLLEGILLLKGYELLDADLERQTLKLTVESAELPELPEGEFTDVLPLYKRIDYELAEVSVTKP